RSGLSRHLKNTECGEGLNLVLANSDASMHLAAHHDDSDSLTRENGELRAMVKQLTSLIEPFLICIMGGIVGTMVVAMFLPLLTIFSAMSGR
ncbi:MAG: hypothetical protein AAEJ04_03995, partial [Planctomycetota bacterium]